MKRLTRVLCAPLMMATLLASLAQPLFPPTVAGADALHPLRASEDDAAPPLPEAPRLATGQTATGQTATGQTATGQTATGQTATGQTATGQTVAPLGQGQLDRGPIDSVAFVRLGYADQTLRGLVVSTQYYVPGNGDYLLG